MIIFKKCAQSVVFDCQNKITKNDFLTTKKLRKDGAFGSHLTGFSTLPMGAGCCNIIVPVTTLLLIRYILF